MNRKLKALLCVLSCSLMTTYAQQKPEWMNPEVNAVNRAPMHAHYFAYETEDAALQGEQQKSSNFMSIDGTWKFNWVRDADQRPLDFYKVDFNDKGWDDFSVPGLWEMNGYGDPLYIESGYAWCYQFESDPPYVPVENNHVGSYRREIELPAGWKGKEVFAHFGSVTSNMYLWVNGKFVGYSEDSKLEAEFNLTKYLKPGKNLIAFQVFRWCDGTYLEDQDFVRLSGVARNCYLYARNPKYIEDIRITPDLDAHYKDGTVQVALNLKGSAVVDLKLADAEGNVVASEELKGNGKLNTSFAIKDARKWSAETPYLYTLTATLKDGNRVLEVIPQKVGIRKVELRNNQVWVNGSPVLIKGVNRHEIDPDRGYWVTPERMLQDIRIMKENNINAVRTCHYPDDNLWYDLCDEYGLYMVAEANVESHGMGYGEKTLAKNPAVKKAHLERNERNVQRNFNHPSIIFWSLGNEAGFGPNFEACYRWVKAEDPSRAVQYEQAEENEFTDIYCPMYIPFDSCLKHLRGNYGKPLIQCEYAHAMGNSEGGFKEYWDLIRKEPEYQGGFIWDFVDQSPRMFTKEGVQYFGYGGDFNKYDASGQNFLDNGLINPDRRLNPHMDEVRHIYQDIWVTPKDLEKGEISVYNEYFFRDLGAYYLEWQLLADGVPVQNGIVPNLEVKPHETKTMHLDYDLSRICKDKEVLLNVAFRLKQSETLLPSGYPVAKNQLSIRPYKTPSIDNANLVESNQPVITPAIQENDINYLIVEGDNYRAEFAKKDGFLTLYTVNGVPMMKEGGKLTPNFWRAPTDNEMGGNMQKLYAVWRNPQIKLDKITRKAENGQALIEAAYTMPEVSAKLYLTYQINNKGTMKVTQKMVADASADVPDMFRFGMRLQMPKCMDRISYYGRGPIENYPDRNNSTDLGRYKQTVAEQFYPYIRPQETGTKSDIRWWKQQSVAGDGLKFFSGKPVLMSAMNYTVEDLDDGPEKGQRHSELVPQVDYTNVLIDLSQKGLGCITSWGKRALPLEPYRIHYGNYEFSFIMQPVFGDYE